MQTGKQDEVRERLRKDPRYATLRKLFINGGMRRGIQEYEDYLIDLILGSKSPPKQYM